MQKIINEKPPFYDKVIAAFPEVSKMPYVVFSYGDELYNPAGTEIPEYMLVHEEVHQKQQAETDRDWWWDMYLSMKTFRLQEEVPAYAAEYSKFCEMYKDRNERSSFLQFQSLNLSGPLYGNLISRDDAKRYILHPEEYITDHNGKA